MQPKTQKVQTKWIGSILKKTLLIGKITQRDISSPAAGGNYDDNDDGPDDDDDDDDND